MTWISLEPFVLYKYIYIFILKVAWKCRLQDSYTFRFKGLGGLGLKTSSAGIVEMLCPPPSPYHCETVPVVPSLHHFFPLPEIHLLNSFILEPEVAREKNTSKRAGGGPESAGDDTTDK